MGEIGDINWEKIRSVADLSDIPDESLYDLSVDSGDNSYLTLQPGLTADEIEDAMFWKDYVRGIMLINAPPGQGKGIFMHMLAFKLKRYFGLNIISDTRPRPLFGKYIPFSAPFLVEQMDRMYEVATGQILDRTEEKVKELVKQGIKRNEAYEIVEQEKKGIPLVKPHVASDGRWISSRGECFIRRSVWLLDEFGSKYMNRREPNDPIHRLLLFRVFTIWRHLDCLIIACCTDKDDLDPKCYPKLTTEVHPIRLVDDDKPERLLFGIKLYPLRFISSIGEIEYSGKSERLFVDGDESRDCLGGKAWKDIYNSKQAIAIEAPKSMRRKQ